MENPHSLGLISTELHWHFLCKIIPTPESNEYSLRQAMALTLHLTVRALTNPQFSTRLLEEGSAIIRRTTSNTTTPTEKVTSADKFFSTFIEPGLQWGANIFFVVVFVIFVAAIIWGIFIILKMLRRCCGEKNDGKVRAAEEGGVAIELQQQEDRLLQGEGAH